LDSLYSFIVLKLFSSSWKFLSSEEKLIFLILTVLSFFFKVLQYLHVQFVTLALTSCSYRFCADAFQYLGFFYYFFNVPLHMINAFSGFSTAILVRLFSAQLDRCSL